jgi:putative peptide zinc metalloprotease protein
LWWLVAGVLVIALVLLGVSFRPGPAWAEMPSSEGLLSVDSGELTAVIAGNPVTLGTGDRRYVGRGTLVSVPAGARGRLTYPGGAATLFCGGVQVQIGRLAAEGGRVRTIHATLTLQSGRVLADTAATSGAYGPLALTVGRAQGQGDVSTTSASWFWVEPAAAAVSTGEVTAGPAPVKATHKTLSCGDGVAVAPPASEPATSAPLPSDSAPAVPSQSVAPSVTMTVPTPTTVPPTTTAPAPTTTPPTEATPTTKPPVTHPTRPTHTTKPPTTPPPTATTTPTTAPPTTTPTPDPTTTAPDSP